MTCIKMIIKKTAWLWNDLPLSQCKNVPILRYIVDVSTCISAYKPYGAHYDAYKLRFNPYNISLVIPKINATYRTTNYVATMICDDRSFPVARYLLLSKKL